MAYRSISDFSRLPSDARFEVARAFLFGAGVLQPGDPVPLDMPARRVRQFYEQRKLRVCSRAPVNNQAPAVAGGKGKIK